MFETELPQCADVSVDTHLYNVHMYFVDGGTTVFNTQAYAGSVAHAALLVGMSLAGEVMSFAENADDAAQAMHNFSKHVIVDVTLAI